MFSRLRERANVVYSYNGGDDALPPTTPDPNSTTTGTTTSTNSNGTSSNNASQLPLAPNHEPDQPGQSGQQLQSEVATTDTTADADSSTTPDTIQVEHPPSTIRHADVTDVAHAATADEDDVDQQADGHNATVNNESNVHSRTFFSMFRFSQSATNVPVQVPPPLPYPTQTEPGGQNDQTEQDTHTTVTSTSTSTGTGTLPPLLEGPSIEKTSNHADSGFHDSYTSTTGSDKPSLLSRMRISATKAFFDTSAASLAGSIHSLSGSRHATGTTHDATHTNSQSHSNTHTHSTTTTPSIDGQQHHVQSANVDTSTHSTWDFSEEIAQDPEIRRLTEQIHLLKMDYQSIKQSRKHAQRRRQEEYSKLKQYSNSKSRELWFASQKMRRFHGIGEYKTELKRCSLPAHDTSTPTLTMEAKLLRAQHQGAILEHQLAIVHEFQQNMIDYLYTKALPDVKMEQELAAMVGKSQLEKMVKARDTMVNLFEDCLGLQRKIIAKYRLREIEHTRGVDGERLKLEVEHLKIMTGEIPAMERNPELRDSAKRRLEERLQVKDRQSERRKSREEDLIKSTQKLIDDDEALVGKATEQIANLSNHSMDLLLELSCNDDSDNDNENHSAKDPSKKPNNPNSAGNEPHDETKCDSGIEISQSNYMDTADGPIATNNNISKDPSEKPSNPSATEEPHGDLKEKSDSSFEFSQSKDTGALATSDKSTQAVQNQPSQCMADSPSTIEAGKGKEVKATMEVSSAGIDRPKEPYDDSLSESQGSLRSATNRSTGTTGRNPPPGIARIRALRAARDMDSSERSLGSNSNYGGEGDQGTGDHSNSESGEDHLEPISPRSTTRKSSQRYAARASTTTGIRSRTELLDRARLARLNNQGGTMGPVQGPAVENAASASVGSARPALGNKAMSSRDVASRRSLAVTNQASRSGPGLGGSEHRSSVVVSSLSSSERSERVRSASAIAAERQARMERIASRRQSSMEVSAIQQARGSDDKPTTISAERRAQIRAGLTGRGVGTKLDNGGEGRKE